MNHLLVFLTFYLFVAALAASFVTAFILSRSASGTVRTFAFLVAFICVYLAGYMMEINSESLADMLFWNQVQYVGIAFYPAVWMVLAIRYTSRGARSISHRALGWLMLVPLAVFLARSTNAWHHLFYASTSIRSTEHLVLLVLGKGPLYYVNSVFNFIFSVVPLWLYLRYARQSPASRMGGNLMFTAAALPSLGYVWILLDKVGTGIDYVALALPVSVALTGIALLRYDFLDVHGLARAAIFDRSKDGMILLDAWRQLRDSNRRAIQILPELANAAEHGAIEAVLAERPELLSEIERGLNDPARPTPIGDRFYDVHISTIYGQRQRLVGYLLTLADVTETQAARLKLEQMATQDALTGLNNRGHFESLASLSMQRSHENGQPCSLLMIDIDHFKRINDSFGHAAGDAVLKTIGQRMRGLFRASDIVGRIGGEEFAVFLPGSALAVAERLADRFREAVMSEPMVIGGHSLNVTVSIGVTEHAPGTADLHDLLRCADAALYEAKRAGRNRTVARNGADTTAPPIYNHPGLAPFI